MSPEGTHFSEARRVSKYAKAESWHDWQLPTVEDVGFSLGRREHG